MVEFKKYIYIIYFFKKLRKWKIYWKYLELKQTFFKIELVS